MPNHPAPARATKITSEVVPAKILTWSAVGSIIGGGLVAAISDPLDLYRGSWIAAYLVLVCGVGAWAIGQMQLRSAARAGERLRIWWQLFLWLAGNTAIILGTVQSVLVIVYIGLPLLIGSLALALLATVRWQMTATEALAAESDARLLPTNHNLVLWSYRALLVILLVSVPIGGVLSAARHG